MSRDMETQLVKYLTDAHSMEIQSIKVLEKGIEIAGELDIAQLCRVHLSDSQEHKRYVEERLDALGEKPSKVEDIVGAALAKGLGLLAQGMPDTPAKLLAVAYAFEHFEIASYRMLRTIAERANDQETIAMVDRILPVEMQAADLIAEQFDLGVERSLEAVGVIEDKGPHA